MRRRFFVPETIWDILGCLPHFFCPHCGLLCELEAENHLAYCVCGEVYIDADPYYPLLTGWYPSIREYFDRCVEMMDDLIPPPTNFEEQAPEITPIAELWR